MVSGPAGRCAGDTGGPFSAPNCACHASMPWHPHARRRARTAPRAPVHDVQLAQRPPGEGAQLMHLCVGQHGQLRWEQGSKVAGRKLEGGGTEVHPGDGQHGQVRREESKKAGPARGASLCVPAWTGQCKKADRSAASCAVAACERHSTLEVRRRAAVHAVLPLRHRHSAQRAQRSTAGAAHRSTAGAAALRLTAQLTISCSTCSDVTRSSSLTAGMTGLAASRH